MTRRMQIVFMLRLLSVALSVGPLSEVCVIGIRRRNFYTTSDLVSESLLAI
jgi:hypothetical protein